MDLDAYVLAHAHEWQRLEELTRRRRLSGAESDEFVERYQQVATHLSVVRTSAPDASLIAHLSSLLSRARNRGVLESSGELIAFTDDDCIVDPAWLDSLGEDFTDPLVMVVTGYVGPLELETRAQCLFELHGGFGRTFERTVYNGISTVDAGVGDGQPGRRVARFTGLSHPSHTGPPGPPALASCEPCCASTR